MQNDKFNLFIGGANIYLKNISPNLLRAIAQQNEHQFYQLISNQSEDVKDALVKLKDQVKGRKYFNGGGAEVKVFRGTDYQEPRIQVGAGYEMDNLRNVHHEDGTTLLGFPIWVEWNDRIQSTKVDYGYFLILYEHINYLGERLIITGPATIPNLADYEFYDRASSMAVYETYKFERTLYRPEPVKHSCIIDSSTNSIVHVIGHEADMIEYSSGGVSWFIDEIRFGTDLECGKDIVFFNPTRPISPSEQRYADRYTCKIKINEAIYVGYGTTQSEAEIDASRKIPPTYSHVTSKEIIRDRVPVPMPVISPINRRGSHSCFAVRVGRSGRHILRLYAPLSRYNFIPFQDVFPVYSNIHIEFFDPITVYVYESKTNRQVKGAYQLNEAQQRWQPL